MIINKIAELRKERNITQMELANALELSRQTIISLEENLCSISLKKAFEISHYFNLPIEEIFQEKDMENLNKNTITSIEEIQHVYGKNTIIIKGELAYRCKTGTIERRFCEHLRHHELPYYGKMKRLIILNDGVYEFIPSKEYDNKSSYVKHIVGAKTNIDPNCIDFSKTPWNENK